MAIERVAKRVREGGHNLPTETIARRYWLGLQNFFTIFSPIFLMTTRNATKLLWPSESHLVFSFFIFHIEIRAEIITRLLIIRTWLIFDVS